MASDSHTPSPGVLAPAVGHIAADAGQEWAGGDVADRIRAAWYLSLGSRHTRAAYRGDLARWEGFLAKVGVGLLEARRVHVDAWARSLAEVVGEAPATRARRLAAISAFYRFAADFAAEHNLGIDLHNPAGTVKRPAGGGTPTRSLEVGEYRALLEAAAAEPPVWGARDAAVVALLGLNGFRVSTLVGAGVDDLGVQGPHRTLTYTVKGGATKTAPLAPITMTYLGDHLDARRALGPTAPGEPLILANTGGRLTRDQVTRILIRCARRAGLAEPDGIRPHVLRATYGTLGERAGISIWDLQDGMDHSDPKTTQGYITRDRRLAQAPTYRLASYVLSG